MEKEMSDEEVDLVISRRLRDEARQRGLLDYTLRMLAGPDGKYMIWQFIFCMMKENWSAIKEILKFTVDYDRTVGAGIAAGKYDRVDPEIHTINFPTRQNDIKEVEIILVSFGCYVKDEAVTKNLEALGLKDVGLQELLMIGEKYPNLQLQFPIIARGSTCQRGDWMYYPSLSTGILVGNERQLDLHPTSGVIWIDHAPYGYVWTSRYHFACVRKPKA